MAHFGGTNPFWPEDDQLVKGNTSQSSMWGSDDKGGHFTDSFLSPSLYGGTTPSVGIGGAPISSAGDLPQSKNNWDTSSLLSFGSGLLTNRANLKEAREQRAWAERLSSTTRQRDVKDLLAAGLNPILAATGGFGGHVSGGASARVENPAHSALQARLQTQEFKVMEAQRKKLNAETANITNAGEKTKREGEVWGSPYGKTLARIATTAGSAKGLAAIVAILSTIPLFRLGRAGFMGAKGYKRAYFNKKTGDLK